MTYYILTSPEGEVLPNSFAANDPQEIGLVRDLGYTWVETTAPAPDPLLRLEADKAFGLLLVDSFVAGSRANGFDLAQTRIINALLGEVEVFLRRGSIGIARDALAEIEPMPLFPQAAKDAYISQIDQYLAQ
jgi:hypothetical protein